MTCNNCRTKMGKAVFYVAKLVQRWKRRVPQVRPVFLGRRSERRVEII